MNLRRMVLAASLVPAALLAACAPKQEAPREKTSTLITGATLIDGTGQPGRAANVRIKADRIAEVGDLKPTDDDNIVDATGMVLAPGFIDTHSHHSRGLDKERGALAVVSQGITTIVVGQDGGSEIPLAPYLDGFAKNPPAINLASYVGHGSVRDKVMGEDFKRKATPAEVDKMKALVDEGMNAGAIGLSSGLEYDPGIFSAPSEVIDLAKVAASYGGRYISHIRSEDRYFWKAVDEIVNIGREAKLPVQVSHVKLAQHSLWGQADKLIAILDKARAEGIEITADIYPYTYWQSTLQVLFPARDFTNKKSAQYAVSEVSTPEGLLLSAFGPEPSYTGKTIAEIAKLRNKDAAQTLMDLIAESSAWEKQHPNEDAEGVIGTSMDERDIEKLLQWPHSNICTDGELRGRHPRGFGAFPRVLGTYVRDRKVLTLEQAVERMSSLGAAHMGFKDRGTVVQGAFADLVIFDPNTVADRATTTDAQVTSAGIKNVWVNGELVYDGTKVTGKTPGRVLRRAAIAK